MIARWRWKPPPRKANAARASGVGSGAKAVQGQSEDSALPPWLQGLSQRQLDAVADHRRSRPWEALPARLQRNLAASWRRHAARRRWVP
jgi:hypothetical protein